MRDRGRKGRSGIRGRRADGRAGNALKVCMALAAVYANKAAHPFTANVIMGSSCEGTTEAVTVRLLIVCEV